MSTASQNRIQLFAFSTGWGVPFETAAPFPLKLATWLRLAGLPFDFVAANDPSKGPKGKSPWIEHDGVRMGDTSLIIEHLAARHGVDLDGHLDAGQRAIGIALQRMLEEHYHQCFEQQLFFGVGGPERIREFAAMLPIPLRWLVPTVMKRAFRKQLHARGMGRHSDEVIIAQGKADLDAAAEILGDEPYLFGDRPSSFDACLFGFLGVSVYVDGDNPLFRYAASKDTLLRYCERMRAQYFPESLKVRARLFDGDDATAPDLARVIA